MAKYRRKPGVIEAVQCFQNGPFRNEFNQAALSYCRAALDALHQRTRERVSRGVEGTHEK